MESEVDHPLSLFQTPQPLGHTRPCSSAPTPGLVSLPGTWLSAGSGVRRNLLSCQAEGPCKAWSPHVSTELATEDLGLDFPSLTEDTQGIS